MATGSTSLRGPCFAAAAAWLLFATVFTTVGGSATPASVRPRADGPVTQASAATASPAEADRGSTLAGSAPHNVSGSSIAHGKTVWSLRWFANDLRKPRPPRQRSERPTTGADGIATMMTASMLRLMLSLDLHRPYVSEADDAAPLAGHYRSLLRPPSVLS
jgi:hypothetical protein